MKNNASFREILIELRAEKKLSQQELADLLDVSRQTIARWESGKNQPSAAQISKLSQVFNIDAAILLGAPAQTAAAAADANSPQKDDKKTGKNKVLAVCLICFFIVIAIVGLCATIAYAIKDSLYDTSATTLIISLPQNTPMIVLSVILFLFIVVLAAILIYLLRSKRQ